MHKLRPLKYLALTVLMLVPVTAEPIDAVAAKGGGHGGTTPVSLSVRRDMDFGKYGGDKSVPGTVVLSPYSDTTTTGNGVAYFGGQIRRAQFRIDGQANAAVFVYLPTSSTIRLRNGSATVTLSNFTMNVSNPVVLNNQGRADFYVGATMTIGANQTAGTYDRNNSFTVSADY